MSSVSINIVVLALKGGKSSHIDTPEITTNHNFTLTHFCSVVQVGAWVITLSQKISTLLLQEACLINQGEIYLQHHPYCAGGASNGADKAAKNDKFRNT